MKFRILTMNNIAVAGLRRLPRPHYEVSSDIGHPDALLLRSSAIHDWPIPDTLKAVARAGAGVNNVPVESLTQQGIPVFNAPGANANAVKELVILAMLMSARRVDQALRFVDQLHADDDASLNKQVEGEKKRFAGIELPNRTLGVIGLGAIGVKVANTALAMGMRVMGYDPKISLENALQLSAQVEQAPNLETLLGQSDFVSVHVPLLPATQGMINALRLQQMPKHGVLMNFSRAGVVDQQAVCEALQQQRIAQYVCDFPSLALKPCADRVLALPHLGASTQEAEENCAIMVAEQLRGFLEHGEIRNSVNFPQMIMPRGDAERYSVIHSNIPHMIEKISKVVAEAGLNISDMLNRSRGDIACTLLDVQGTLDQSLQQRLAQIEGVIKVRHCQAPEA